MDAVEFADSEVNGRWGSMGVGERLWVGRVCVMGCCGVCSGVG